EYRGGDGPAQPSRVRPQIEPRKVQEAVGNLAGRETKLLRSNPPAAERSRAGSTGEGKAAGRNQPAGGTAEHQVPQVVTGRDLRVQEREQQPEAKPRTGNAGERPTQPLAEV